MIGCGCYKWIIGDEYGKVKDVLKIGLVHKGLEFRVFVVSFRLDSGLYVSTDVHVYINRFLLIRNLTYF